MCVVVDVGTAPGAAFIARDWLARHKRTHRVKPDVVIYEKAPRSA